jgi:26S proteasome regulatory subunit T2
LRKFNINNNLIIHKKAICTEAGLMALRERRMKVTNEDFKKSKENVLYRKNEGVPEGLYL